MTGGGEEKVKVLITDDTQAVWVSLKFPFKI